MIDEHSLRLRQFRAILDNHDHRKGGLRPHRVTVVATNRAVGDRVPSHDISLRATPPHSTIPHELATAVRIRRDHWLAHGLSSRPADRSPAESAVAELYRRAGFDPPEFTWLPSPAAASTFIADQSLPGPSSTFDDTHPSVQIASLLSTSRGRMDARIQWRYPTPDFGYMPHYEGPISRHGPPPNPERTIRRLVRDSLRTTLFGNVATAIRRMLPRPIGTVSWYGQQEAHRIGYYDTIRHCGLAGFGRDDHDLLDLQTTLAASTGWWWAFGGICVMADRPTRLHTELEPGGVDGERRLHHSDRASLEYQYGTRIFVHHGTTVPEWVMCDPNAERIGRERNVEVRRCAIERIGWDAYIEAAGLTLVDRVDDPGNPGCLLELYDTPGGWGMPGRILLAVNGSPERDGTRRRYGLPVPAWVPSALDAAGWTYGISGSDYSLLVRRT